MASLSIRWRLILATILHLILPIDAYHHPLPIVSRTTLANGPQNFTTNSTNIGNNTLTAPECKFSATYFRTNLSAICQPEIDAIQACPTSAMSTNDRRGLAKALSACAVTVYDQVSDCSVYTVPRYHLPPFESDDRLGLLKNYLNPFSSNVFGKRVAQEPEACKNPDILPIMERSISIFHNDTDGRWLGVEKTPYQYLRCVLQAPESEVESCVESSIRKLQYLPNRLIVYNGQKKCNTEFQIMFQTIEKMVLEVIYFIFEVWRSSRKRKVDPENYRSFSWVGLFRAVIVGTGTQAAQALIIHKQFPNQSIAAALGLYFLLPQAAPFIAFLSGCFLSKGFGTQTLLVDLVTSGIALVMYNLPLKSWAGSATTYSPGQPSTALLYNGLYFATLPAGFVFAIYQGIMILAVILFIWSMMLKKKDGKGLAQASGYLIGLWILMWVGIISFAVFAIAEIVWQATTGRRKREGEDGQRYRQRFPLILSMREFFYENNWGRFMRTFGYWAWVLVSFVTAAGRWLFILQLLKLTGQSFCPDSLASATAAGFFIPFGAIGLNILLKWYGLAL